MFLTFINSSTQKTSSGAKRRGVFFKFRGGCPVLGCRFTFRACDRKKNGGKATGTDRPQMRRLIYKQLGAIGAQPSQREPIFDFASLRHKSQNWGVAEPTGTDFFSDSKRQRDPTRGGLFISAWGVSES